MAADRGMDLTDEIICHTPRLREMHDRYLEEKNAREDAAERLRVNKKFSEIKKAFEANTEHFDYQKAGLKIFVPRDAADIRREGKLQHHCVGATDRYMERMAKGETFILYWEADGEGKAGKDPRRSDVRRKKWKANMCR